ncbi:MAG: heparinase II/III family protein [Verrucomicrobiales bacterium]|nr:heparinase II/III family protein [Verrucomicrobiales bacterium]
MNRWRRGRIILDEIPEAAMWLDYAVNKFYAAYPVWSDDDGGWHEGVSYWSGYLSKSVWWLQIAQSALGIDGLRKPFFAQVGDFPLYVAPPHSPNIGFGDLSHRPPNAPAFLEYFIRVKGSQPDGAQAGYWRWWSEQLGGRGNEGILGFLYAANLPPMPPAKAPTDLPTSKIFRGIGVASLHTTLLDSREDVHFLFKSSPFGTQSHGHNPHNTFQLNSYGEALLTTCVYRDLHGSKFHYQWAHSTLAHNGVLVDGAGQIKHTPAPHGRIADFQLTPEWDYVVGDATEAYGGRLERYRRHVLFVKGEAPILVLYDDLAAREPATFQFLLHALSEFTVDPGQQRLSVTQPKAGVTVRYLAPAPLAFRQWDGYEPPPDREFPNQWHVEASTPTKEHEVGMLTVLLPYRTGQQVVWTLERVESGTAVGVRATEPKRAWLIGFRKPGVIGRAALAGVEFATATVVRPLP